jgi:hypothetical protein
MQRRDFLKSSLAFAGTGAMLATSKAMAEGEEKKPGRQFYELRHYSLRRGPQQDRFDKFYREAAIPAFNRAGISRVGVFNVAIGPESSGRYVLLTYPTAKSIFTTPLAIEADEQYQKDGADYLNLPATDPGFIEAENSLMATFEGMPQMEVPAMVSSSKSRVFELRTYRSPSLPASMKKISMFNQWEISIFKRVGLPAIFFGQTMFGTHQPNLTYLLGFENAAAREKGWAAFGADAEWNKVRKMPGYSDADLVCDISNILLRPAPYSQI